MVLAILHAVDIIAEYLSSVDIEEAAAKRKQSYDRGFIEPFFLTTSERDLKSKRPILSPEKFVYCTRMMEVAMTPDELSEFNKMMFNHYRNALINGGDEVNADVRQLCQEGILQTTIMILTCHLMKLMMNLEYPLNDHLQGLW